MTFSPTKAVWPALLAALIGGGTVAAMATSEPSETDAPTAAPPHWPADDEVGQTFLSAPNNLPELRTEPATLAEIQHHLREHDLHRALRTAEAYVEDHRWGRDRDAAWLVIGMIHREAGRHNLASEAFTKVRQGKGPLEPWGAFHEAEQDMERGRPWVAIRECEAYRERWPEGPHADACWRLIARAHAAQGHYRQARAVAEAFDEEHEDQPVTEQVELALARWQIRRGDPKNAVYGLQKLAAEHDAPLMGRAAADLLRELELQDVEGATLPDDTASLKQRALSLRNAKRTQQAWEAYQELVKRSADDPALQRWVEGEAETFGWRTRNWDFLVDYYTGLYEESPNAKDAWSLYKVLGRGGRFAEALAFGLKAQQTHAGTSQWRRVNEDIGRIALLARDYEAAKKAFDARAARGGWSARRARFYAAFASTMGGTHDDAEQRWTKLIDDGRYEPAGARYWRSKVYTAQGKPELAEQDVAWVLAEDPWSWYGTLIRQNNPDLPKLAPFTRDGRWPGSVPTYAPTHVAHSTARTGDIPVTLFGTRDPSRTGDVAFQRISWDPSRLATDALPEPTSVLMVDPLSPPKSYAESVFYEEDEARKDLWRYAERHKDSYPHLRAVYDMSRVGLYDLSGPLMSSVYEAWKADYRAGHSKARTAYQPPQDWRPLFLYARDHHHTARFTHGLWDDVKEDELKRTALTLSHPLAHDRFVWTHAREHGIDPYLVLGLMRQESTYNSIAVSRVGARGAMQIMPRTGHLLADRFDDMDFMAGDLEDPTFAVGYGIAYLGLLMERFDGVYPLAVASYNGGPFNVSQWLKGTGNEMTMDAWVEHIPFRETRDYVKKVSTGYAAYLDLYATPGTHIQVPATPLGDHPEVVNF